MMIGQLASTTGLSVRTLRFYADAGVLPENGRSATGYRLFGQDAIARARLIRTLRELGVGLDDIKRVLAAETSLADVAAEHARALDAQISLLRLQRAVLRAFVSSADPEELQLMTDLTPSPPRNVAASSRSTSTPYSAMPAVPWPTNFGWGYPSCRRIQPPSRSPPGSS